MKPGNLRRLWFALLSTVAAVGCTSPKFSPLPPMVVADIQPAPTPQPLPYGQPLPPGTIVISSRELGRPGIYPWHEGMKLFELIQTAGGLSRSASQATPPMQHSPLTHFSARAKTCMSRSTEQPQRTPAIGESSIAEWNCL